MQTIRCTGITVGLFFLLFTSARAATYFVGQNDPNASDKNSGDESHPWKTLACAANAIKSGDNVYVKAGTYREPIAPRCSKVTFRVYRDDAVIIAPPETPVDPSIWSPVAGHSNVFQATLDTNGKLLSVDDRMIEFELIRGTKTTVDAADGTLHHSSVDRQFEDTDIYRWTTGDNGMVKINLAGENPARHRITLRQAGFTGIAFADYTGCTVQGFRIENVNYGISFGGSGNRVEDCVVFGADIGAVFGGSQNVLLRSALLRCWQGVNIGDGVGNHVIDETFVIGTGQPVLQNRPPQADLNNPWGPRCSVRYGNASFNVFRYSVIADGVWAGWWPDVNCYGNYFYGNLITRVSDRGVYNEYPANDSRILYNAVTDCMDGITSRFCWRTMWMYNYLSNNRNTELRMWGPHVDVPYMFDNVIAKNLISGGGVYWSLQDNEGLSAGLPAGWPGTGKVSPSALFRMRSNLSTENIFKGKPTQSFGDINGVKFASLKDFQDATGFERGSRMDDNATMDDLGLGLYTVRIPQSSQSSVPAPLVGNPIRQGVHIDPLPMAAQDGAYFWMQGDAAVERGDSWPLSAFSYTYEWPNFEHPVRRLIAYDRNADPNQKLNASADPQTWLECFPHEDPKIRARTPADGSGFWSTSMPTVPGSKIQVSFLIRGKQLKGANGEIGPVAFVRFKSLTGQHGSQKLIIEKTASNDGPLEGDFPWRRIRAEVIAPEHAERFAVFLGLKPADGTVDYADIHIDTTPAALPVQPVQSVEKKFETMDLAHYTNHELDSDTGAPAGAPPPETFVRDYCSLPIIDLSKAKPGKLKAGKIPFMVKKAVSLRCARRQPSTLPASVQNIVIGKRAASIYFLAAGPFQMGAQEYWRCLVHYADGQTVEVLPVNEESDVFYRQSYFLTSGPVQGAARMPNDVKGVGKVLRWKNPRPNQPIQSLDLRSMDTGQVVLLGITLGL